MYGSQLDGGSASLFSGGGFMPSQSTHTPDSGFLKSRGAAIVLPLTVKQISEAYHSNDDKSNFVIDGVDASNGQVRLLGIVMNKAERVTDVSFSLDDGSGRIDVNRWVNETSDTNEMAIIQNGMYVSVNGSLKGFQGKRHVVAFSVRPVTDFNQITLHFLECIYVHLDNTRPKVNVAGGTVTPAVTPVRNDVKGYQTPTCNQFSSHSGGTVTPVRNDVKGYQTPTFNQFSSHSGIVGSENDIHKLVLNVFQEASSLVREHGLHVDEVVQRLGLPIHKIKDAIEYHVDIGNIYSTIDENHYKSAING